VGVAVSTAPQDGNQGGCFFVSVCASLSDAVWQQTFLAHANIDTMLKTARCGVAACSGAQKTATAKHAQTLTATPLLDNMENTIFMTEQLTKKCIYCGSSNIDESSEKESRCRDCGMGKYAAGKR